MTAKAAICISLLSVIPAFAGDAPPPDSGAEVTVYAAVSLRDALNEIAPSCQASIGSQLVFNFGASNELARQIVAGNKADVFVSADESWMEHIAKAGLLDMPSRRVLVSNRLVVIAPSDSSLRIEDASDLATASVRRISLANPEGVPAGKYARAWLEKAGVWAQVQDRVLPATDVRAALAAVESGGAEIGVVYATDAAISDRVRVLHRVSEEESGTRIVYPIAVMQDRPLRALARKVVDCLAGPGARDVFQRRGFVTLPPP